MALGPSELCNFVRHISLCAGGWTMNYGRRLVNLLWTLLALTAIGLLGCSSEREGLRLLPGADGAGVADAETERLRQMQRVTVECTTSQCPEACQDPPCTLTLF